MSTEERGHVYVSAGERSGDQHAASMVGELLRAAPGTRVTAMGGEALAATGAGMVQRSEPIAVMGLVEVLRHLGDIRRAMSASLQHVLQARPDVVVLVDYPGFHLRLARAIKKRNPSQRILYYICPKFWAWKPGRVKELSRWVDEVLCIFPFEPKLLAEYGVPARFVGNPLLDQLDLSEDGSALRGSLAIPAEAPLVGIFPGSRAGELRRMVPLLVQTVERVGRVVPEARFVFGLPPGEEARGIFEDAAGGAGGLDIVRGRSHELLAASTIALAKSGTVVLEAALFGCPVVALYRMNPLTAWIASQLLRVDHFTLPNILLADFPPPDADPKVVVPELLQGQASVAQLVERTGELLQDAERRASIRDALRSLRSRLGGPGASRIAAEAVLQRAPGAPE